LPGTGTATVVPWILIVFSISIPSDIPLGGPKQVIKPIHLALLHGLLGMFLLPPDLQQQHTEKLRKKRKNENHPKFHFSEYSIHHEWLSTFARRRRRITQRWDRESLHTSSQLNNPHNRLERQFVSRLL
jgi:hypothetical protein